MGLQREWRWCSKCQGLFFFGNASKGSCPSDRAPHDVRGSGRYVLHLNDSPIAGQSGWKWCSKCQGLFFAGGGSLGLCAADGRTHAEEGSGNYTLLGSDRGTGSERLALVQAMPNALPWRQRIGTLSIGRWSFAGRIGRLRPRLRGNPVIPACEHEAQSCRSARWHPWRPTGRQLDQRE